jgi:hypothetical protein
LTSNIVRGMRNNHCKTTLRTTATREKLSGATAAKHGRPDDC